MGRSESAWFEEDSFWLSYASLMFDAARWAEVPAVVDGLLRLSGVKPGAAVLDSCCGPGRHGLELARRGYKVCGVDRTRGYIEAFADSAAAEGLDVELVCEDVRRFERPEGYELALNLFTSFGYFETAEEDLAYAASLRRSLKPGGALIIDVVGKELAARDFTEGEWFERDGALVLTEFSVVGAWEGLRNRWIVQNRDQRIDRTWVQRLYSGSELRQLLLRAGFAGVELFGSPEGTPYDQSARSLIAVARR